MRTDTVTAYLIHFDTPYKHARHYIGVAKGNVEDRIRAHEKGQGARLMQVIKQAGITWRVARIWEGVPFFYELKLKARGGASRLCPICQGKSVGILPAQYGTPNVSDPKVPEVVHAK